MSDATGPKICGYVYGARVESIPSATECSIVGTLHATNDVKGLMLGYFQTIWLLMRAGFCLLIASNSYGDDIFKPTGRFAQTKQTQWYLVSEVWCVNCPPAKARFLAKGWPAANVITIAEAKSRFGKSVPFVPFEFPEPEQPKSQGTVQPAAQVVTQTQQYRRYVPQRRGIFRWRR